MPGETPAPAESVLAPLAFAHRLDPDLLSASGMAPAEVRAMLDSLAEFTARHATWLANRLASHRANFSDGSNYFFQRIKELREAGRQSHKSGQAPPTAAGNGAHSPA